MRTWHALVLLLSCGCSLDTNPRKGAASLSEHDGSDAGRLAAVSFDAWRRAGRLGARHAAFGGDRAQAEDAGEQARDGAAGSGKDAGAAPHEPVKRDPAAPARAPGSARDPAVAQESGAGGSAAASAARIDDALDAGTPGSAATDVGEGAGGSHTDPAPGAAGGPAPAADGGSMSLDAAMPPQDAAAPEEPDTPEQQQARARLLDLVQKTLDNSFGPVWTPDAIALSATVRSLAGLPENQRTRPLVAGVLIRLRATNACRFDNAYDCKELCSALDADCGVCRWDASCQVSVELMCAPQQSFSCDPWQ